MLEMEIIIFVSALCLMALVMGLALTTLSLFIWTEDATSFIIKTRSGVRVKLQCKMLCQIMKHSNINYCFTYLMHFIAAESKEIYSTTLRFKIGGLSDQLSYY